MRFSDYKNHKDEYEMYNGNAKIPDEFVRKDEEKLEQDDYETIKLWMKKQDFGGADVKITQQENATKITSDYISVNLLL